MNEKNNMLTRVFLLSCFVNNIQLMLCALIGAIMLSINIHVGLIVHHICVNYIRGVSDVGFPIFADADFAF